MSDTADMARIVGIVGDVPIGKIEDEIPPTLYMPFAHDAEIFMQVVPRTTGDPAAARAWLVLLLGAARRQPAIRR